MATESSIRFSYATLLAAALRPGEESAADKVLAARFRVSERQVRKARMGNGTVDAFLADAMATGLGQHPVGLFGWEAWIEVGDDLLEQEAVASEKRAARKASAAA